MEYGISVPVLKGVCGACSYLREYAVPYLLEGVFFFYVGVCGACSYLKEYEVPILTWGSMQCLYLREYAVPVLTWYVCCACTYSMEYAVPVLDGVCSACTYLMEYAVPVLVSSIRPFSILYGRQKPVSPFSTSSLNCCKQSRKATMAWSNLKTYTKISFKRANVKITT